MADEKVAVEIALHRCVYEDLNDLAEFQGKTLSEIVELGALTYLSVIVGSTEFRLQPRSPLTLIQGGRGSPPAESERQ